MTKSRFFIVLFAVSVLMAVSCSKEGPSRFKGNWSFKTSGTVLITPVEEDEDASGENTFEEDTPEGSTSGENTGNSSGEDTGTSIPEPGPKTVTVAAESGQMDIVVKDKSEGDMIITMDAMLGNVYVVDAKAEGRKLTVIPFKRKVTLEMDGKTTVQADVTVSGEGERFEDTIVLNLVYSGVCTYLLRKYEITGSDIRCVAKLNDF